jgi:putative phage-type endonuclease
MTFEVLIPTTQITQGSPEWFASRLGKATASRIADIIARTKTGYSTSRANYAAELVCERLTGTTAEGFKSPAMLYGQEMEPEARNSYVFMTDLNVLQVGAIDHPSIDMAAASPDGIVLDNFEPIGLIEIKCPNSATHIDTLLSKTIPGKYFTQMQWQMACTGAPWCDFVSYDKRLPPSMRMFIERVPRDQNYINMLEDEVKRFLYEVEATVRRLKAEYGED